MKPNRGKVIDIGIYDRQEGTEISISKAAEKYKGVLEGLRLDTAEGKKAQLEALLAVIRSTIPLAEAKYKTDQKERNSYALTNLINTAKEIVMELSTVSDTESIFHEVNKWTVESTREVLKEITFELKEFEKTVLPFIPKEKTQKVKNAMNESLRKIGEEMKMQYDKFSERMEDLLGVKK